MFCLYIDILVLLYIPGRYRIIIDMTPFFCKRIIIIIIINFNRMCFRQFWTCLMCTDLWMGIRVCLRVVNSPGGRIVAITAINLVLQGRIFVGVCLCRVGDVYVCRHSAKKFPDPIRDGLCWRIFYHSYWHDLL